MEDLKRYRVDFKVTYHCIGHKGFFRKKEYSFDWIHFHDMLRTTFYVNARNTSRAVKKARAITQKNVDFLVKQIEQLPEDDFLIITGNVAPNGDFKWSPRVYRITSVDVELAKVTKICTWKEERIEYAMKHLSVEEFKTVFEETIPQQEEN